MEGMGERFGGTEAQGVDTGAAQGAIQFGEAVGIGGGKLLAHADPTGIEFKEFAGLGVFDGEQAGGRQDTLAWVVEVEADEVVAGVGETEFLNGIAAGAGLGHRAEAVEKVGEEEDD